LTSHRIRAGFLGAALLSFAVRAGASPETLPVGRLILTLCNTVYTGYCGSIERPLDPNGRVRGTVTIGFEYYPRRDPSLSLLGTILPQEGGPGYSSTGSRDFYLGLFDPLRARRAVLIVDKRGTGLSEAIDCPELQTGSLALSAVAACAKQLGSAAWLYRTDHAAGDIVAVLDALDIDDVDFYGDSYGTFFGQVLAGLYPKRLRSIVLDSAYPVRAPDPWFATDWATAWSGMDLTCERSPSCDALGGSATARMRTLIAHLRQNPITGTAPDGFGILQPTTVDAGALIRLIDASGSGASIFHYIDAAARAWLDERDALPILRMVAENETSAGDDPATFSYGLYTAVICEDYPLLYDLNAGPRVRTRQYADALEDAREDRPNLFAPFSIDEGLASQVYITPLDTCLPWPVPLKGMDPGEPLPPGARYPAVPTLVLSGDLDSVTSPEDAQQTTEQFPNAVHLIVPNLTHVVAGGDMIGCTSSIVLRFVQDLSPGDTRCIRKVRPVRTVPRFARHAHELAPLGPTAGDESTDEERRIAAAALETVGDVIAQWYATLGSTLAGLRGGSFSYNSSANGYDFQLQDVQWTEDVAVSGAVSWNTQNNTVTASVDLKTGHKRAGTLHISWNDANFHAIASVQGQIHGAAVRAQRTAP
jgi:pimeloyl-ACP methyl ester carboxylesterase